ncbi:MAG: hypothetical protein ACJASX_003085 [Limisphaerales bacterium]|jgi:hypothetical protein
MEPFSKETANLRTIRSNRGRTFLVAANVSSLICGFKTRDRRKIL